ncbi:alpha/beta hydrolase [Streptomyces sp. GMY02]|uniref:alpha/beta fold hydrolase n=1 Tax=Streptomyces sp. GMY02 TaxID=1333528 RepID=UPI001C2C5781|nr:alpha/beta hydrolase [Streptomyces sp. GMY02]QXE38451.1 alpha/beta hydrolase [Streptomyces sp. GMY02]
MQSPRRLSKSGVRLALAGAAIALAAGVLPATQASATADGKHGDPAVKPTIVLVHGAWADGSSWNRVVSRLQHDGYTVRVPPNPLRGVAGDSAYLASYLKTVPGPVVLVGHSYGGFLITNAATGNTDVKALVYVDAYIPAQDDTLNGLTAQFPGSHVTPDALDFVPSADSVVDAYLKPTKFHDIMANDLPARQTATIAAAQRPLAASTLDEPSGAPAWKTIPSWDVIGTADHAVPAAAQEFMAKRAGATVTKVRASHLSMISHPATVKDVIEDAARHTS